MVFGELIDGRLAPIALELLGCGRMLAKSLGEELHAVVIGGDVSQPCREAVLHGADRVMAVEGEAFGEYRSSLYERMLLEILKETRPRVFLMGNTDLGQELSVRLAFRLDTVTVLDCIDLSIDPESGMLVQTKPVYGGKGIARLTSKSFPQMATVRPKSMAPGERDESRKGEVVSVSPSEVDPSKVKSRVVERVVTEVEGVSLDDAEVVVSGGRGMGGSEGFAQLAQLARLLGGAVGASRAACDEGWVPTTMQVGLTGKIIAPKLYIAVALSGASQHMTGCSGAGTIVAFNRDARANIFSQADFGVVGDWRVTLPVFIKEIEALSKG